MFTREHRVEQGRLNPRRGLNTALARARTVRAKAPRRNAKQYLADHQRYSVSPIDVLMRRHLRSPMPSREQALSQRARARTTPERCSLRRASTAR